MDRRGPGVGVSGGVRVQPYKHSQKGTQLLLIVFHMHIQYVTLNISSVTNGIICSLYSSIWTQALIRKEAQKSEAWQWFSMHLVTSSQGCQVVAVGHGSPTLADRTPVPLLLPPPRFPSLLILLSCSSLIAFTALLISQIGLIDWIWFLWIEQLYWVAFSLMDRSVCACVCVFVTRMHACMSGMIKENFLSSSLLFCNPAASPLPGISDARSLQTRTCSMLTHMAQAAIASEWMFYYGWCKLTEESVNCGDTLSKATLNCSLWRRSSNIHLSCASAVGSWPSTPRAAGFKSIQLHSSGVTSIIFWFLLISQLLSAAILDL